MRGKRWAKSVALPKGEKRICSLMDAIFTGWEGQIGKYWSIENGNSSAGLIDGEVVASTYLFTKKSYRNFRLLLEVRQTRGEKYSTMHSAVCALGEKIADKGDPYSFKGPLLMFCNDQGIWDANRRNRVYPLPQSGACDGFAGKDRRMEPGGDLVIGNRIRMVENGQQVIDFTDSPEMLTASPIGFSFTPTPDPQEYRFRGLVLVENPKDKLATLQSRNPKNPRQRAAFTLSNRRRTNAGPVSLRCEYLHRDAGRLFYFHVPKWGFARFCQ